MAIPYLKIHHVCDHYLNIFLVDFYEVKSFYFPFYQKMLFLIAFINT